MEMSLLVYVHTNTYLSSSYDRKIQEIFLILKITSKIGKMPNYQCHGILQRYVAVKMILKSLLFTPCGNTCLTFRENPNEVINIRSPQI